MISLLIRYTIVFILISGWSFLFGFKIAQDYGLDLCKKAGWEFIEDKIFPKRMIKENIFGEKYAQKQLNYLQSSLSTKCIVKFRPWKK